MLFLLLLVDSGSSQQVVPQPTPPDESDVVRISTNLIQVDVTVTDKKGNVITDLKQNELEIYENGKKQDISNFSFVPGVGKQPKVRSKTEANPDVLVPIPGSQRPEKIRRTIALVVDDLSLSFENAFWVQKSIKQFVLEQMQEGDLVAIIRTGSGVGALQQFTTDKRQLLAAAEKIRYNFAASSRSSVFNPIYATPGEMPGRSDNQLDELERENNELRESIFASGTLGALNFIVRGMKDLAGRKSILLISEGFSLITRDARGMPQGSRIVGQLQHLTDLANRASVVVYTLDPRGLTTSGLTAADNTIDLSAGQIEDRLNERSNLLFETQEALRYIAKQTGGFAVINQNFVDAGIRKILDDQSYYLVGYQPDDDTFDPKVRRFNKLEIKVLREGARVRYRSGFFGIAEEQIKKPQAGATQTIFNALTSPFAINDISLRLNAIFASGDKKNTYLRSYLHVDAGDLTFTKESDGTYKTVFDLVAMSFGENGVPVDQLSQTYTINIKGDAYQQVLKRGFVYHFTFPVKKPGGVQMRVAVRDSAKNTVGSANQFVDIPNLKKNRLTLSGMIFESMTPAQWARIASDGSAYTEIRESTDPLYDTSLRQFKKDSILRYGVEIYNARPGQSGRSNLTKQVRIFCDGKVFFEGPQMPVSAGNRKPGESITTFGTVRIGAGMPTGDYVLQIVVIDSLAKEKRKVASQFVTFEVVE